MRSVEEFKKVRHRVLLYFGIPVCLLLIADLAFHQSVVKGDSPTVHHVDEALLVAVAILMLAFKVVDARLAIGEQQARARAALQAAKPG